MRKVFQHLIPKYEKLIEANLQWPGWFEDVCGNLPQNIDPLAMHFLNPEVLEREFKRLNFEVEFLEFIPYKAAKPEFSHLDGRELIGAIVRK